MQTATTSSRPYTVASATPPCITIVIPAEHIVAASTHLQHRMKCAVEQVEKQLISEYPSAAGLMMEKLKRLSESIEYNTQHKAIVAMVAPGWEEILYVDVPMEERVAVTAKFDWMTIIRSNKEEPGFLLLLLSAKHARLFHVRGSHITRLILEHKDYLDLDNDIAERVANFSDPVSRKEVMTRKFLHHVDHALTEQLKSYPLPVVLACTDKTYGYFMDESWNAAAVVDHLEGNFDEISQPELTKIMQPLVDKQEDIRAKHILAQLSEARNRHRCFTGIQEVYDGARQGRGRLLVIEDPITGTEEQKMADQVIYEVLKHGGTIELLPEGRLAEFEHIALVAYY